MAFDRPLSPNRQVIHFFVTDEATDAEDVFDFVRDLGES
jgi:hypothetical protein